MTVVTVSLLAGIFFMLLIISLWLSLIHKQLTRIANHK